MTLFFRLLDVEPAEKAVALTKAIRLDWAQVFDIEPSTFALVPGSPFAYWVSNRIRSIFVNLPKFEGKGRIASIGASTKDDFRYLRLWWEVPENGIANRRDQTAIRRWVSLVKGGAFSPIYSDPHLVLNWSKDGNEIKADISEYRGKRGWGYQWSAALNGYSLYFRPGLTWPRRTNGLSFRLMPSGCIFADKGPAIFVKDDKSLDLLALCMLMNSQPFRYLVGVQLARTELAQSYEVGLIQQTPTPNLTPATREALAQNSRQAWSLKRTLDSTNETSHAFLLPTLLRSRVGQYNPTASRIELAKIERLTDDLAFDAYGVDGDDRRAIETWSPSKPHSAVTQDDEVAGDEAIVEDKEDAIRALHSWTVGVAFGRFDIRLATGERQAPPEPEPFDPLLARNPGMIPESDEARFPPRSLLVDDPGHTMDLATRTADVLERVGSPPENPEAFRRWLARDFFPLHIKMCSKSRRKAPIYWQLATPSASYSVWLYIHVFSRDVLYQVQEISGTKLLHEERKLEELRAAHGPSPTSAQRKELENQESFVEELRAFLDEVRRVAPLWNPNLDDGVIINFAPLWRLVPHHKPWQKELKDTWDDLCAGKYDWAHLAMHLWPERVVPQCATDRSLAIAHDFEDVFWVEGDDGKWKPRPKPTRPVDDLVRERTSPAVKAALKSLLEAPVSPAGNGRGRPRRGRRAAGAPA